MCAELPNGFNAFMWTMTETFAKMWILKTDLSCSVERAVLIAALSLTFVDRFIYFCICVASNIHFYYAYSQ